MEAEEAWTPTARVPVIDDDILEVRCLAASLSLSAKLAADGYLVTLQ